MSTALSLFYAIQIRYLILVAISSNHLNLWQGNYIVQPSKVLGVRVYLKYTVWLSWSFTTTGSLWIFNLRVYSNRKCFWRTQFVFNKLVLRCPGQKWKDKQFIVSKFTLRTRYSLPCILMFSSIWKYKYLLKSLCQSKLCNEFGLGSWCRY